MRPELLAKNTLLISNNQRTIGVNFHRDFVASQHSNFFWGQTDKGLFYWLNHSGKTQQEGEQVEELRQWNRISHKQSARWQHLSWLKASAFSFSKKMLVVWNATTYTWDWICLLVDDGALSFMEPFFHSFFLSFFLSLPLSLSQYPFSVSCFW